MISFEAQISGDWIGRALATDPEEAAYALKAMWKANELTLGPEIADHLYDDDRSEIAAWLRDLANQISPSS